MIDAVIREVIAHWKKPIWLSVNIEPKEAARLLALLEKNATVSPALLRELKEDFAEKYSQLLKEGVVK
jgi:hypothetical protein